MRLVTYSAGDRARVGAVANGAVVDLGDEFPSMLALIEGGRPALDRAREVVGARASGLPLREVSLLAPIPEPRRNVLCVGWNYLAHFEEGVGKREGQERPLPDRPTFFTKPTEAVVGPEAGIACDAGFSEQFDYEGEIAVVIGRRGRSIARAQAGEHIFGYALANDVSARDVQRRHGGQWFKGKAMDASCPFGPWIVTADEVPDTRRLALECRVNGVLKQQATTAQMIFPIDQLVEELSLAMTLLPGDVLLTGTPEGVGYARTPPEFLHPGDEVVVSAPWIGYLRNPVVATALT